MRTCVVFQGYYRCTQALIELERYDRALHVARTGRRMCPDDKHLKEQEAKIRDLIRSEWSAGSVCGGLLGRYGRMFCCCVFLNVDSFCRILMYSVHAL